jgi:hypothetical protein
MLVLFVFGCFARALFLKQNKRFESWFVWRALSKTMFAGMDVLQYVLPIGVFVYRFAEWWNSPDNEALRGPKRITKVSCLFFFRFFFYLHFKDSSSS